MLLLEFVQLVEVAKQLGAVGSYITRVRELDVCPFIREDDFARHVVHICKSVVDLGQLVGGKISDEVLPGINPLKN